MAYLRSQRTDVIPAAAGASYEEGIWTHTMTFDGGGPATFDTPSYQYGQYSKIGNLVYVSAFFSLSSMNSGSGGCYLGGFPYNSGNDRQSEYTALVMGYGSGLAITAGQTVTANVIRNNSYATLRLWDSTGGVSTMNASELSNDGTGIMSGSYWVD